MQMAGNSPTIGLGTIMRAVFIVCAVVIAVVLLLWIRDEQGHLSRCADVVQRQYAVATMTSARPVHVVVHVPSPNVSGNGTASPPVEGQWNYNWDHKQWADRKDADGVPTRTIVMIRHGQYEIGTGQLTERGRHQANLTGSRLRQLNLQYDRIVHSDLDRAAQTAKLIHAYLPRLPIVRDPMLAEGGPVPPEPTVNYWSLPDRNYFVEGPRLEAAFRQYIYRADKSQTRDSVDILVAHGNILRYMIIRALQFPRNAWMRMFLPHASISKLDILADGTVTLSQFGDSGHIPPEYVTY